jgi:uridine kinase
MGEKVMINLNTGMSTVQLEVDKGTAVLDLAKQYQPGLPYQILAARVNNKIEELDRKIDRFSEIQLLDMRDPAVNLIYQRGATFIYIKAAEEVLGTCRVHVENSLNQGLYTEINQGEKISRLKVAAIEKRMREIVEADIPFKLEFLSGDDIKGHISIPVYSCGSTRDAFYGFMVPSTGYIRIFELRKYGKGILLRFPDYKVPDKLPPYRDDRKLYAAFQESEEWGKLMGVSFVRDLNEKIDSGEYRQIIQISEALHEKKVAQIADKIARSKKRIILISGPSSSGKTTFANRLCIQLMVNGIKPIYLGTDDYFVERHETPRDELGNYNFEDIEGIDLAMFNRDMNALLNGDVVDLPKFDFISGTKIFGRRIIQAAKDQPLVIEGIHGLNKKLTECIPDEEKFKIYISPLTQLNLDEHNRIPTTDARMLRRIVRDHQFRNYSAKKTIGAWPSVRKGEDKNIFPFSGEADVLFNSVHIYELAVLKKYVYPLLLAINQDEPEFSEAVRLLKFIHYFKTIEDDQIIPNNSVIREFIGGSIFFNNNPII